MAMAKLHSNFTHLLWLYLLLLSSFVSSLNVTDLLSSSASDLSDFASLLVSTAVAPDLSDRSSFTILAVPNPYLIRSQQYPPSSTDLADVLRYHVLLEFLTLSDLHQIPPTGKLVTTLFQTTGRAASNFGTVNITFDSSATLVTFHTPASNATMLSLVKTLPNTNISIVSINSLLIPFNPNLMASETRPPLGLNITKSLIDGHNFNVAASMLAASGLVGEFEGDEGGAGITLLAPKDEAFADLPSSVKFQSLPADKKAVVLKFHVLHSYYPLGSLQSIVNPVYPTLATEQIGAGSFTVNISRVNGSVAIDTGIVQASITQTVIDQNPVAIFGVSRVLLPKEFFGKNPIEVNKPSDAAAQPPDVNQSSLYHPPGLDLQSAAKTVTILHCYMVFWSLLLHLHLHLHLL